MTTLRIAGAPEAHKVAPAADSGAPTAPGHHAAGAVLLSIEPLVEFVTGRGGLDFWVTDNDRRAFYRARLRGEVTPEEADRLAIGLVREHPCVIWGWDAWSAAAHGDEW